MASNQIDRSKSNPLRKVRVVAKIRGFSDPVPEAEASSRTVDWVSVNKPQGENSDGVTLSFGEHSSSRYLVDYCYEEHEENEIIFSREVKPLISAVFEGHNSTVFAYGARGSGKTHVIQGSDERPGLAVLSITEFLSMAEKNGKSVAISFYEVDHQEHAVDLLNPEQPPILVFEDRGRIQFKGLTQTLVKSIAEFQNLHLTACSARKAAPKKGYEHARRSHMGLIVHVFSQNETIETGLGSKMNFVDLAGYEDARRKSSDDSCLAEINKINKSIYALLNVCHALSTNDNRVPYRESKLTRILQDTMRGTSKILMVACLNPSLCQDTIYMVNLASRSCQLKHQTPLESTKKSESLASKMVTSQKSQINKSISAPLESIKKNESKMVTSQKSQINKSISTPLESIKKNESKMVASQKSQINKSNSTPLESTKKNERSASSLASSQKSQMNKSISTPLESTKKNESLANKMVTSQKGHINRSISTPLDSAKKNESSANKMAASQKSQLLKSISTPLDSAKKNESSAKKMVISQKSQIPKSISTTAKKLTGSRSKIYENKAAVAKSATMGRKLFDEASHSAKADKAMLAMGSTSETSMLEEEEISIAYVTKASEPLSDNNSLLEAVNPANPDPNVEKDNYSHDASTNAKLDPTEENDHSSLNASSELELYPIVEKGFSGDSEDQLEKHTPYAGSYSEVQEGVNKENNSLFSNEVGSPPISSQLRDLSNSLKLLCTSTPLSVQIPEKECTELDDPISGDIPPNDAMSTDIVEPKTPVTEQNMRVNDRWDVMNPKSPWEAYSMRSSGLKNSLVQEYLKLLNTANKEELKKLKGIGEKRATYILELREESPEPFKSLDDLKDIGLSAKQIKGIMKKEVGGLFSGIAEFI